MPRTVGVPTVLTQPHLLLKPVLTAAAAGLALVECTSAEYNTSCPQLPVGCFITSTTLKSIYWGIAREGKSDIGSGSPLIFIVQFSI